MPGATSHQMPPRATSPRSALCAGSRRAGSSSGSVLDQKSGEIDRMPLQFLEVNEEPVVGHPLRIEDPVEMIAFVLNNPGMKALDLALDHLAVEARPAVAHPQMPRHDPAQPGNRETAFPSECALST